MTAKAKVSVMFTLAVLIGGGLYHSFQTKARRQAVVVLKDLHNGMRTYDPDVLFETLVQPEAIGGRSVPEQTEFLRKALLDEISAEGLAALEKHGRFGSLKKLFPDEADAWARQAGVEPDDCVAFRMEHNGHRAEVVLARTDFQPSDRFCYRIVRINNVRQMAESYP